MNVYIVTAGEYSDYHIEAVFLDERKAYAYCESLNKKGEYDCRTVETYDVTEEESELTRLCVYADFCNDEIQRFYVTGAILEQLTFRKNDVLDRVFAKGDIKLRKDETIDNFRKRAKKVVIDRYFDWKLKQVKAKV